MINIMTDAELKNLIDKHRKNGDIDASWLTSLRKEDEDSYYLVVTKYLKDELIRKFGNEIDEHRKKFDHVGMFFDWIEIDEKFYSYRLYERIRKRIANIKYLEELNKDIAQYQNYKKASKILLIIIAVIVCAVSIFTAVNIKRYKYPKQEKTIEKYELIKIK